MSRSRVDPPAPPPPFAWGLPTVRPDHLPSSHSPTLCQPPNRPTARFCWSNRRFARGPTGQPIVLVRANRPIARARRTCLLGPAGLLCGPADLLDPSHSPFCPRPKCCVRGPTHRFLPHPNRLFWPGLTDFIPNRLCAPSSTRGIFCGSALEGSGILRAHEADTTSSFCRDPDRHAPPTSPLFSAPSLSPSVTTAPRAQRVCTWPGGDTGTHPHVRCRIGRPTARSTPRVFGVLRDILLRSGPGSAVPRTPRGRSGPLGAAAAHAEGGPGPFCLARGNLIPGGQGGWALTPTLYWNKEEERETEF